MNLWHFQQARLQPRRTLSAVLLLALLLVLPGCFSEQSFPMVPADLVRMDAAQVTQTGRRLATRAWVARVHAAAAVELPADERMALTTDELSSNGKIVDVWAHFGMPAADVDSLWGNWDGIAQTAQVSSPPPQLETNAAGLSRLRREKWDGFEDVEVPGDGATLFGRLGAPDKKNEIPGSFVIMTHGLFGSLDGYDVQNHVQALRRAGHHVLAMEMRGHGETQVDHPEYTISFGIRECGDLLAAARWLKTAHGATRVGLVSFSLTAYEALLSGWLDGKKPVTEFAGVPLLAALPKPQAAPAFNGGMFVVSAPVGIIDVADRFEPRLNLLNAPCKTTFQDHVAARLALYRQPAGFSMWALAAGEFDRSGFNAFYKGFPQAKQDLVRFLDMNGTTAAPEAGAPAEPWNVGAARMENIRVPVVVLSAANDPLGTGQSVAELFGRQNNPNIGVILLHGGGHMGFTALSADYYYSLLLNFFDPRTAPAIE